VTDLTPSYGAPANAPALAVPQGSPRDYLALLKPRVMSLVLFTGVVGLVLAPGAIHPLIALVATLCIAVGAGASGAINMWYDRDIDAVMARTRGRPIPSGRITPDSALGFGITLAVASVAVMGLAVNWVAAGLLAFTIFFYVVVYTIGLKRRTPQNIVIGGAAGAFPPMIGWAAVTGEVSLASIVLFAIIFLWTPPHFWALALYRRGDYDKAGVPMLPVVAGEAATRRQIFVYALALAPVTLAPCAIGLSGFVYGVGAALLGLMFIGLSFAVLRDGTMASAKRLFPFSILYLFLIFALLLVDRFAAFSLPGAN
jgi:protoheme IX farnesyltransferase